MTCSFTLTLLFTLTCFASSAVAADANQDRVRGARAGQVPETAAGSAPDPAAYSRNESVIVNPVLLFTDPLPSADRGDLTRRIWQQDERRQRRPLLAAGRESDRGGQKRQLRATPTGTVHRMYRERSSFLTMSASMRDT